MRCLPAMKARRNAWLTEVLLSRASSTPTGIEFRLGYGVTVHRGQARSYAVCGLRLDRGLPAMKATRTVWLTEVFVSRASSTPTEIEFRLGYGVIVHRGQARSYAVCRLRLDRGLPANQAIALTLWERCLPAMKATRTAWLTGVSVSRASSTPTGFQFFQGHGVIVHRGQARSYAVCRLRLERGLPAN